EDSRRAAAPLKGSLGGLLRRPGRNPWERRSLPLLREPPGGAVERPHRTAGSFRRPAARERVLPPERESVRGRTLDPERPERADVEDRIRIGVAEVEDHR